MRDWLMSVSFFIAKFAVLSVRTTELEIKNTLYVT